MKKALIAFSGGLDTSFMIPYLKSKGYEAITATVNTGGFSSQQLNEIAKASKKLGAIKHYSVDAKEALYQDFASYIIKANYQKGGTYPACVGPERNVIAIEMAKIAKKEKIKTLVHGSTGAGNDQVRFDLALKALVPDCEILAPIRDEGFTREQEIDFLKKHGFELKTGQKDYSINIGLLGTTIGGKETKGTEKEVPAEAFPTVKSLTKAKKGAAKISLTFDKGLPVKLNGKTMGGTAIISELNKVAAEHGFGKDYHIGTTIIGIKGRIAFEAPALKIIIKSHTELEKIVLTSKQLFWKNTLGNLYGDLVHEGLYFDPLVRDLEAFLNSANSHVSGEVVVKIETGTMTIVSLRSKYSLLDATHGTYGELAGGWSGEEAKAFCKLYGMESVNAYLIQNKSSNE